MRRERSPEVIARHWQHEAERQSLEADRARAEALQWQKLCAAAILDAARAEADRAVREGREYLAAHGCPLDAPESPTARSEGPEIGGEGLPF